MNINNRRDFLSRIRNLGLMSITPLAWLSGRKNPEVTFLDTFCTTSHNEFPLDITPENKYYTYCIPTYQCTIEKLNTNCLDLIIATCDHYQPGFHTYTDVFIPTNDNYRNDKLAVHKTKLLNNKRIYVNRNTYDLVHVFDKDKNEHGLMICDAKSCFVEKLV